VRRWGRGAEQAPATAPASDPGFPRTVTHAMGTTEIPARLQRVVALDNGMADLRRGPARPPSQQGGDDVSAGQVEISEERILDANADHIFVTAYPDDSGASAANRQRFESNPLWGRLTGQIHEVSDLTWMSAVGMQGAHAILDDLAATFGVDPARD
jgi:iron complex transport system substrate-binding protein